FYVNQVTGSDIVGADISSVTAAAECHRRSKPSCGTYCPNGKQGIYKDTGNRHYSAEYLYDLVIMRMKGKAVPSSSKVQQFQLSCFCIFLCICCIHCKYRCEFFQRERNFLPNLVFFCNEQPGV